MVTRPRRTGRRGFASPMLMLSLRWWLLAAIARGAGRMVVALCRWAWPYRRELAVVLGLWWLLDQLAELVPAGWALLIVLVLIATVLAIEPTRRLLVGWLVGGWTRRQLHRTLASAHLGDPHGRPPRVLWVTPTPVGERVRLRLRPGQSMEALDVRADTLRAALHCRQVRLDRDPGNANAVVLEVVRRDPLTVATVAWADQHAAQLSIWDPVHFGVCEQGLPVRVSLVERAVLMGGARGAGKSGGLAAFVGHAAKSPDVHLLLIDANKVQLGPWAKRALVFADHRVDDAVDVVRMWRDEIDKRLSFLAGLPGMPLALTRQIGQTYGLPMWLLVVDELAYHTSVAGTPAQQKQFYALLRDGVARGRAAGCSAIVATQRPTHDLVPTSLRDLFDIRIAYRCTTPTSSDVILGDTWARQGFNAAEIGLNARGVAYLLAEEHQPQRVKTVWLPPKLRLHLAATTVPLRPAPPLWGSS
jgi:S-DNA-T family DNA segregation ATPase FtsK/SpoIIIE